MDAVKNMVDCDQRNILHIGVLSRNKTILEKVLRLLDESVISELIKSCDIKGKANFEKLKHVTIYPTLCFLGNIPLHLAAQTGKLEDLTKRFIDLHQDSDIAIRNEMGQTAFHVAAMSGNKVMIEELYRRDKEAKELSLLHTSDIELNSPLHLASLHKVNFEY